MEEGDIAFHMTYDHQLKGGVIRKITSNGWYWLHNCESAFRKDNLHPTKKEAIQKMISRHKSAAKSLRRRAIREDRFAEALERVLQQLEEA